VYIVPEEGISKTFPIIELIPSSDCMTSSKLASGSEDCIKKLVEQLQQGFGFSDSTQRASSDRLQNSAKSLLSALQLIFIIEIIIQKYGTGHFDPF